ncbi:MAG TPA: cytochrome c biogenesis protein CcsA, partial [Chitinispirillaceae bacterium]|nr:cytochrome c biogenesis protein CcsA [Chitinispirillaceae bacterium]
MICGKTAYRCLAARIVLMALLSALATVFCAHAGWIPAANLGKIIILDNGRKKPLDTFARNKLRQFSGKAAVEGSDAIHWLARVVFNTQYADNDLVFLINNPDVADALGISPRPKRRYSFSELHGAMAELDELSSRILKNPPESWSQFDREIIRTSRNLREYISLRSSFSFFEARSELGITDSTLSSILRIPVNQPLSYVYLLSRSGALAEQMVAIQKGGLDSLTPGEASLVRLVGNMREMESVTENPPPHIIPETGPNGEIWFSFWGYLNRYRSAAVYQKSFSVMKRMYHWYRKGNQSEFDKSVREYISLVKNSVSGDIKIPDPTLELIYNRVNPFFYSKVLYGIAALLSILALSTLWKKAYQISLIIAIAGLTLHTFGITARMVIMSHPPVTNLYETFIFTAWASSVLGLVLELTRMRSVGVFTAAVTGFLFLHIAGRYALDGDTFGMLSAILDSSFWLTTHIVTIALGYAGCVAAGFIGHIYLIQKMLTGENQRHLKSLSRSVYGIFCFGFIFTVAGTVFGGMWADQAWGRFWGWDPKENGALLIIIWGLIVLHSRAGRLVKDTGVAFGAVIGVILVMCTWIGVNLLGTGLHSYGFTSTGAVTL